LYLSTLSEHEVESLIGGTGLTQFSTDTVTSMDQLLDELEKIRDQRFAIDHQEFLAGTVAIGVPVFDFKKRLSLVLTVQAPVFRLPMQQLESCLPALREASHRLEELMRPNDAS
jgi:DNA-binding IclR family transcriptional regulator